MALQNLDPAIQCALRQAEESFCDFFGLRLFAESFLHAFAYLLTPGGTRRVANYPNTKTRITNLLMAAKTMGISPPDDFAHWFRDDITMFGPKEQFLVELADDATASITASLLSEAIEIANAASVPTHSKVKVELVRNAFSLLTPAAQIGDLVNILVAAWEVQYEVNLWEGIVPGKDRRDTLNELVLKSIEILEFEERMSDTNGAKS